MAITTNEQFLRQALRADALTSGATGLLMAGGAGLLTKLLALPEQLLLGAGLALLPFAALVAYLAGRAPIPRAAVWAVILVNGLWALDSVALLLTGWVAPNLLAVGFVLFQAAVVAGFALLQYQGLRKTARAAA
jgi:hypothetical protein